MAAPLPGKQRRCIWIPNDLARRLDGVAGRVNISTAASSGILAMVSVAEQDPDFKMPGRVNTKCNRGHSMVDPHNVVQIDGRDRCRTCAEKGRRFPA